MLFHDLRIAIRHLLKSPGFTATAVLMLALGIGATTAIFSIVEGVLLRPLPFPQPEKLVALTDVIQGADVGGNGEAGVTVPDVKAYTRDTHSFESLGGYRQTGYELSGIGEPVQVNAARLSAGVFPALEVAPLMGRFFTQQEDDQKEQVAVIGYSLWQSRLHGDPSVLGTKILLDRKPYVIIGVMPRNFEFPLVPGRLNISELWVPMSFTPQETSETAEASWNFSMVGRLKPGITAAQAESDAERAAQETMRGYPAFMASLHIRAVVRSLHEETVEDARQLVRILFLAIVVVLLIVCANLAGLMLVRAIRRRREIAVRLALGAPAGVLLRQAILESLVLSVSGGTLGLILAAVALRVGVSRLPENLPRIHEIGLDWQVVLFAIVLAILTGLVCGLAPAFAALRTSVNDSLKEGGRTGTAGGGHARLRSALVVGEIAIALVLLVASGLLLRSFEKMRAVDLGFRPDHILTASYSLPQQHYATQAALDEFNDELLRRVQQLPGVKSVGLTSFLPASGSNSNSAFIAEGYAPPKGANINLATTVVVQGDYLQAMGIPLLAGRFFSQDDTANTQLVVVVNHKLAEHYWPGSDPVGKRLRDGTPEMQTPWLTVVGEVADVKENSPDLPDKEQFYQPVRQIEKSIGSLASPTDLFGNGGYIAVRTAMPPEQMANVLRATVRSIDPQLPLDQVQSMEQAVSGSEAPRRFNTALISAFAIAAVLLAALGIYSVIAFSAALRTQEMAIRIALGSQRSGILRLVFSSAAKLAVVGCVLGLLGAATASHLLNSFLFGVSPFDPLVLTLAAVFVLMLALVASLLPAQRAASINPMKALRAD
ncbi:MAG TPA: ABC transporter permease [Terriglobales bacterium]|jgi:putative ABC transport system permease protein|nr:ABC transporter permease [Terriglobales bacterium]